jgi:hypothetical protein
MRRGVVNVYLTVYAPITLQAIEMLVCKLPCDACDAEGEACAACGPVNVVDTGVHCWDDDHWDDRRGVRGGQPGDLLHRHPRGARGRGLQPLVFL